MEQSRLKEYLTEVYRILRDIDRVNSKDIFPMAEMSDTSGHRFEVDMRKSFHSKLNVLQLGVYNQMHNHSPLPRN